MLKKVEKTWTMQTVSEHHFKKNVYVIYQGSVNNPWVSYDGHDSALPCRQLHVLWATDHAGQELPHVQVFLLWATSMHNDMQASNEEQKTTRTKKNG